jgi:CSLREA domain-containing protein
MSKQLLSILVIFTWVFNPATGAGADAKTSQAASAPAELASAIVVNDLSDTPASGDGLCSLREAITNANTNSEASGGDCQAGSSGLDAISFSASGTITLTAALPFIEDDLSIDAGGQPVTINGANAYQVLVVLAGANLSLAGLRITDGACDNCNLFGIFNYGGAIYNRGELAVTDSYFTDNRVAGSDASGGAIYNRGTLTVTHSLFSGNSASNGGRGGGIYNYTGHVSAVDSIFSANQAAGAGGGIYNDGGQFLVTGSLFSGNLADAGSGIYNGYGALAVTDSSFLDNQAIGPGGNGGGLLNDQNASATVTGSTFSGNSAITLGGGILNGGALTTANTTFSANDAGLAGGGIFSFGTLTVTNGTLSGNSADMAGGVYNQSGVALLRNTIVANSLAGGNCAGTINADGYDLSDDATCGGANLKSVAEIHLGPLADNGGKTQTMALLAPSAAIDAGDDALCAAAPVNGLDQRAVARPQGAHCDVGAYEYQAQSGPSFRVNTTADTDDGNCAELGQGSGNQDCSLREALQAANALGGANDITFQVSGTITLTASLPAVAGDLAIDASGQSITLNGAKTFRVLAVNGGASLDLSGLAIADGYCDNCPGGAIYNAGRLAATDVIFSGGRASLGGGLYNEAGAIATLAGGSFSANAASSYGGGIYTSGTLTITNFTLSNNNAASGGGIYSADGALAVAGSTFDGNSASQDGGGVYNSAALSLVNSTFYTNLSSRNGGGVYNSGTLTITNSTLSADRAEGQGGGIYSQSGIALLRNTIVANSPSGANCFGTIEDGGHNLDSQASCGWSSDDGSLSNAGPLLDAPADNGETTQTMVPLPFSPAIDAGDDDVCRAAPVDNRDQRGVLRPVGPHCDIGAVEAPSYPNFLFLPLAVNNSGEE